MRHKSQKRALLAPNILAKQSVTVFNDIDRGQVPLEKVAVNILASN